MSHHRRGGLVVPDASAVVVLLIDPSTRGDAVAQLLRGATLFAPSLLPYEVANVLRRRRTAGLLSDGEARIEFDALRRLPVELWPFEVLAAPSMGARPQPEQVRRRLRRARGTSRRHPRHDGRPAHAGPGYPLRDGARRVGQRQVPRRHAQGS